MKKQKFDTLDAGRGLAALAVCLRHASEPIVLGERNAALSHVFLGGALGVSYFFVLSGTVILLAHVRQIGQPRFALQYLQKRARRIYPVFWIAMLLYLVFALRRLPPIGTVVETATLLRIVRYDYVMFPISWTLFHEILFYLAFLALILHRRVGAVVFTVWCVAGALSYRTALADFGVFPSSLQILFPVGMAAGWLLVTGRRIVMPWLLSALGAAGMALLVVGCAARPGFFTQGTYLLAGVATVLLLLGAAELERRGTVRVPPWLKFLGSASYSLYLFHPVVLVVLGRVLRRTGAIAALPGWVSLMVAFLFSSAIACLAHAVIERPLLTWVNSRSKVPVAQAG